MQKDRSLIIKKPISELNNIIEINYKNVFIGLGKIAYASGTGSVSSIVNQSLDLLKEFGLNKELNPEQSAWLLISQALIQALNTTVKEYKDFFSTHTDSIIEELAESIHSHLEDQIVTIDLDFFENPEDLSLLDQFKLTLIEHWLKKLGFNEITAEAFFSWFKNEFVKNLHHIWAQTPGKYVALNKRINTPFASNELNQKCWFQYNNSLCYLAHERIFDEEFTLKQIYVELNAYYEKREPRTEDEKKTYKKRVVVNLNEYINSWLESFDPDMSLMLVSGGPGYGKSSYSKILVSKTAEQYKELGIVVMFVPLSQLNFKQTLKDSLEDFLLYNKYKITNPLSPDSGKKRILLVFDGLDELSIPGLSSDQIANTFIKAVRDILYQINLNDTYKVQALITGRDAIIQTKINYIKNNQILRLLPYYLSKEEQVNYENSGLFKKDLRDEWWKKYSQIKGMDYKGLPEQLKHDQYFEITREPLLLCLIALRFVKNKEYIETNLSLLHKELFEHVYEKKWRSEGPKKEHFTLQEFFFILEKIALTIWQNEKKTISLSEIKDLDINKIDVITSFYFRKIDSEKYEFIHKTFSEYLTAKAIINAVKNITNNRLKNIKDSSSGYSQQKALTEWLKISGSNTIGLGIYKFILDEIKINESSDVETWQKIFFELLLTVINKHIPMYSIGIEDFPQLLQQARNAEEGLLVIHSACFHRTGKRITHTWDKEIGDKEESYNYNFSDFWQRIHSIYRKEKKALIHEIFAGLELNDCNLSMLNFSNTKLHTLELKHSAINNTNCQFASFINGNFLGAKFQDSNLHNATFTGDKTILRRCNFNRANFSKVTIGGKNIDLTGAQFIEANCTKSNFNKTILKNVDFSKSILCKANFIGAILDHTIFNTTNLSGVLFEGATLDGIEFINSDLRGTDFRGATLNNKISFIDSDLRGIKFSEEHIEFVSDTILRCILEDPEPLQ